MSTADDLARQSGLPRLESRMLLAHVLGRSTAWLLAHGDEPLAARFVDSFQALASRRRLGEPMAYLVGMREFMGHEFQVSPAVLIPRPETELLVEAALESVAGRRAPRILDLGTGSGAVSVSIALARPDASVTATDLSADALAVAQGNAQRLGARVQFAQGSWYDALSSGEPFDVIVSNPPYVRLGDPHLEQGDLRFEPSLALTDGADGLAALREIIAGSTTWLVPGGSLWLEHGFDQGEAVRGLMEAAGYHHVVTRVDLAGHARVTGSLLSL